MLGGEGGVGRAEFEAKLPHPLVVLGIGQRQQLFGDFDAPGAFAARFNFARHAGGVLLLAHCGERSARDAADLESWGGTHAGLAQEPFRFVDPLADREQIPIVLSRSNDQIVQRRGDTGRHDNGGSRKEPE